MKRKSSKSFSRRPRPLETLALYSASRPQPTMPQVRELLAYKRKNKREPIDMMGSACEVAFERLGKTAKPLSRKQRFEARKAKREAQVAA